MKRLFIAVCFILCSGIAKGGDLVVVPLSLTGVTLTSTNDTTTSSTFISGEIKAIYFTITAGKTCTVEVASSSTTTAFPSTIYLTKTGFATAAWYYPRVGAVNASATAITDSYVCPYIHQAFLELRAKSASASNTTVTASVIVEKE